eukprot:scaffold28770_cov64-Phaeocystis_antarctica.AAC.4
MRRPASASGTHPRASRRRREWGHLRVPRAWWGVRDACRAGMRPGLRIVDVTDRHRHDLRLHRTWVLLNRVAHSTVCELNKRI